MGVLAFNHFNLRAPKPLLEEVRTFYVDVVGLAEGFRPAVPGPWLLVVSGGPTDFTLDGVG